MVLTDVSVFSYDISVTMPHHLLGNSISLERGFILASTAPLTYKSRLEQLNP